MLRSAVRSPQTRQSRSFAARAGKNKKASQSTRQKLANRSLAVLKNQSVLAQANETRRHWDKVEKRRQEKKLAEKQANAENNAKQLGYIERLGISSSDHKGDGKGHLYPRTAWYMTPVPDISETPTAFGYVPPQYALKKWFIPPPPSISRGKALLNKLRNQLIEQEEAQERAVAILAANSTQNDEQNDDIPAISVIPDHEPSPTQHPSTELYDSTKTYTDMHGNQRPRFNILAINPLRPGQVPPVEFDLATVSATKKRVVNHLALRKFFNEKRESVDRRSRSFKLARSHARVKSLMNHPANPYKPQRAKILGDLDELDNDADQKDDDNEDFGDADTYTASDNTYAGFAKYIPRNAKVQFKPYKLLSHTEQLRYCTLFNISPEEIKREEFTTRKQHLVYFFRATKQHDFSPYQRLRLHPSERNAFSDPYLAVTAFSLPQVPRIRHHTRDVEIVFVGRSNVGKSSLLNALTRSKMAKVGQTPGKTQSLNFYALSPNGLRLHRQSANALATACAVNTDRLHDFLSTLDSALVIPASPVQEETMNEMYRRAGNGPVFTLVDVPGYGRANAPVWLTDKWNVLIGAYLRMRSPRNFQLRQVSSLQQAAKKPRKRSGITAPDDAPDDELSGNYEDWAVREYNRIMDDTTRKRITEGKHSSTQDSNRKYQDVGFDDKDAFHAFEEALDLQLDRLKRDQLKAKAKMAAYMAGEIDLSDLDGSEFDDSEADMSSDGSHAEESGSDYSSDREHSGQDDHQHSSESEQSEDPLNDRVSILHNQDFLDATMKAEEDSIQAYMRHSAYPPVKMNPLHSRLPPMDYVGPTHGSPLKQVVVLLDAHAGLTRYDLQFLDFLEGCAIPHQVVLTKIDQLSTNEVEGAAFSISQTLFPHEYVKLLEKSQPLGEDAYVDGKLPKNSPSFCIKSPEQDKLWELANKYTPRHFCSPLLLAVSSSKNINIDALRHNILYNVFQHI